MASWAANVGRGYTFGAIGYALAYKVVRAVGPGISSSMATGSDGMQAEWTSCVVSTVNAIMVSLAMYRRVLDPVLRADRIYGIAKFGAEFWFGEVIGYFTADLALSIWYRETLSNFWGNVAHHVISIASYGCVVFQRRGGWYACALLMLETTTPFGNFRWLMSKSESKIWGKGSILYQINGLVWLGVFFLARVASIPFILRYGVKDALMLWRSTVATRADRSTFGFLVGAYLLMQPLNLFWFSKMVQGALRMLKGIDPEKALAAERGMLTPRGAAARAKAEAEKAQ